MKMNERIKKALSILLCLCMLAQNAPVMAFAAAEDNLCDHHTEHTADCGYVEGESDCAYHCDACLGHDHGEIVRFDPDAAFRFKKFVSVTKLVNFFKNFRVGGKAATLHIEN